MTHWRIKTALFINYFVFAILLNSVGTVILQVQNTFGVSASAAATLEAFKDLPIAITSFLIASFVARIGYKLSMLLALAIVIVFSLLMPSVPEFWMSKVMFVAIGASFALVKVSVFATLGLVTANNKEHVSLMNFLESFFMVGVLSGYFVFSAFVDDTDPGSTEWLNVYYVLALMSLVAFGLLAAAPLDESSVHRSGKTSLADEFLNMLALVARPLVMIFVVSAFLYVLIEQSVMSWLPTFNNRILHLPATLSIEMASILAAATALGRLMAGMLLRRLDWFKVLSGGLLLAALCVLIALPLAEAAPAGIVTGWGDAPLAAFIFPLIGFCIAPIYPAINSIMLSSLPQRQHAPMAGLIVVFSALGGATGSIITGNLFEVFGGLTAFYFSLAPIVAIVVCLYIFKNKVEQHGTLPGAG